jgi:hypothetical protein
LSAGNPTSPSPTAATGRSLWLVQPLADTDGDGPEDDPLGSPTRRRWRGDRDPTRRPLRLAELARDVVAAHLAGTRLRTLADLVRWLERAARIADHLGDLDPSTPPPGSAEFADLAASLLLDALEADAVVVVPSAPEPADANHDTAECRT